MTQESNLIEDPILGHRLRFEQRGEAMHVEMWVDPGGGVTPHVHPSMQETFTVVAGNPSFLSGRRWIHAEPGETVTIPAGTRHAFRNRGSEVAHVDCTATPALTLQAFLTETAELSKAGKLTRRLKIPKGPRALLDGIALAHRHREMVVLGFPPMPPRFVQRRLFPLVLRLTGRGDARL